MKTVIADNSLCAGVLFDDVSAGNVSGYIRSLAAAGAKFVEVDFRTVMKIRELPSEAKYIFRMVDPMFMRLTEVFDFDYVLINFSDLKKKIKTDIPIILELPVMETLPGRAFRFAQSQVDGDICAVRLCGSFDLLTQEEASSYIAALKNNVSVPVDLCPMNAYKTAVDTAVKFTFAGADSVTLSMSSGGKYAGFEDYLFALMSIYDTLPSEFNAAEMCKASVYHKFVFRNSAGDSVYKLMNILDNDIRGLKNADTGESVKTRIRLRDAHYLHHSFISAVERMVSEGGEFPEGSVDDLMQILKSCTANVFDDGYDGKKKRIFLN